MSKDPEKNKKDKEKRKVEYFEDPEGDLEFAILDLPAVESKGLSEVAPIEETPGTDVDDPMANKIPEKFDKKNLDDNVQKDIHSLLGTIDRIRAERDNLEMRYTNDLKKLRKLEGVSSDQISQELDEKNAKLLKLKNEIESLRNHVDVINALSGQGRPEETKEDNSNKGLLQAMSLVALIIIVVNIMWFTYKAGYGPNSQREQMEMKKRLMKMLPESKRSDSYDIEDVVNVLEDHVQNLEKNNAALEKDLEKNKKLEPNLEK